MLAYHEGPTTRNAADAARNFLETRSRIVWTAWVSDEVAGRVQAALN